MAVDKAVDGEKPMSRPAKSRAFLKKPERPDFAERDAKQKMLQAKIQEYMDLAKVKGSELEALQNENKANHKVEGLKRSLANATHIRAQAQKLQAMTRKRLEEFKNPKRAPTKRGVDLSSNPQALLNMMEQLKDKVTTERDPQEQAKIIARIQALNASYVQLTEGADGATSAGDGMRSSLADELAKYDAEVHSASNTEAELRDQLEELQEQLASAQPHIERLKLERETCWAVVNALRDKVTEINDEWQGKFDTWKQKMNTWQTENDAIRKERDEQYQAEQKARQEEREAREREARGPPFSKKIILCDQMLTWCKKYGKAEEAEAVEEKDAAEPVAFDGMVVKKKAVPGADDVFATSSRNKSKKAPKKASSGTEAPAKVQHDMETLALFARLQLPVPTTAAEVDDVRQAVEAKKSEYEALQTRALAGEEVPEEEEEAPEAPRKRGGAKGGAAKPRGVSLSLRCDEAFGMVLVELAAH